MSHGNIITLDVYVDLGCVEVTQHVHANDSGNNIATFTSPHPPSK
jgi:hypothetical protein